MRLFKRQDGIALPTAVSVLAIVTLISAAAVASAVQSSDGSRNDRDAKRAFAAAEAGIQAATHRLNKLVPSEENCVTNVSVGPDSSGYCAEHSADLGNNASYTFRTSRVLQTGDRCAGYPLKLTGSRTVLQRCVNSTGVVNGVRRRVEARIASYRGAPIFPVDGLLGREGVTVGTTANVDGRVGSNGQIRLGNNSTIWSVELANNAPNPVVGSNSTIGQTVRRTPQQGPFLMAQVDPGNSSSFNDNGRIVNGINGQQADADQAVNVSYDETTRVLRVNDGGSLVLGGGTYNFCDMYIGNGARVSIAPGATVRIFIDSPERNGAGCAPSTGNLRMGSNSAFNNTSTSAVNLQIYVYGSSDMSNVVDFSNAQHFVGALYAPQSKISVTKDIVILGAMAANELTFGDCVHIVWDSALRDLDVRTVDRYYRTAWRECKTGSCS